MLFRKVEDVKREEELERQQLSQPPLELSSDHPVRKLFNRFKKSLGNVQEAGMVQIEKLGVMTLTKI